MRAATAVASLAPQLSKALGVSAPAASLLSTLPETRVMVPSSVTVPPVSFEATGVSSTTRIDRVSLAVVPPMPLTTRRTLSVKSVEVTASPSAGTLPALSIAAMSV